MSKLNRCQALFSKIASSKSQPSIHLTVPTERIDGITSSETVLSPHNNYFQIQINEFYLSKKREWFYKYMPLVCVVSEFIYDNSTEVVPFVVGPSLIERHGQKAPDEMLFLNTRVAGIHPYRGGRVSISLILCRVRIKDYAKALLQLTEKTASAIDFSTSLSTYLKIGNVLIDGIEALFDSGDTQSLIGIRNEFDLNSGNQPSPGYFVLINAPDTQFNSEHFWVRDNRLLYGEAIASAIPFRDTDYVLYSLSQSSNRQDISLLPFYSKYEEVKAWASKADDQSWQQAKHSMQTLYCDMVKSPDLIPSQVRTLVNNYVTEMRGLHKVAIGLGSLGATDEFDIGDITNISTTELLENSERIMALKL